MKTDNSNHASGTHVVNVLWAISSPTFTYIIEHFVQVGGVHDEVGVAHHVVYGVRLQSKRERKDVKVEFSHQVAVLGFFSFSRCLQNIFLSPTFSLAAFLVSASIQLTYFRFSSKAHLISPTIPSTWSGETDRGNSGEDFICECWTIYLFIFKGSSPWPCCPRWRCPWQTWLRARSPGRCPCHRHTASSEGCSSADKQTQTRWLTRAELCCSSSLSLNECD